jgi:hypothetical protein
MLGFLDHERAAGVDLARGAEVLDVVEGPGGELVHADAVAFMVDDVAEGSDEAGLVCVAADDLED